MENNDPLVVKSIPILRMDCPTCIPFLEREVKKIKGVKDARGSYMTRTLKVSYDPEVAKIEEIEKAIEDAGYRIAYKKYPGIVSKIKGLLNKPEKGQITSIDDDSFEKTVRASTRVAVVFTSPTCPACKALKQVYEKTVEKLKGIKIYEMDVSSTNTWHKYDILSVPTILVFQNGEVVNRVAPSLNEEELIKVLME